MLNLWLRLNKLIRLIRWDKSEVMSIQILWNKYVSILWAMICIWYLWYKVQIFPFFEPMIYIWYLWNNISLEQWYVYIYGTNMSILKTMICVWYLWNKYVRTCTWNNYMGLSLLNLNVKEQVYSYRNRTSLVCTLSGTDKTSLHQCQLIM